MNLDAKNYSDIVALLSDKFQVSLSCAFGSPRHATKEVVFDCGVLRVLEGALPFSRSFGCCFFSVSPHACRQRNRHQSLAETANDGTLQEHLNVQITGALWSHHGVSGCESGPEARVCQPHWIEEPAAQAESTPSLAGSEERETKAGELQIRISGGGNRPHDTPI